MREPTRRDHLKGLLLLLELPLQDLDVLVDGLAAPEQKVDLVSGVLPLRLQRFGRMRLPCSGIPITGV